MNWVFLVLGVIFAIPPLWEWQKIKAKEPTKMTRKAFFICSGFALFFILCYVALAFSKEATAVVIVLMDLGFFAGLILTIYYAVKSKKQKEDYKNKLRYSSIATIGFFALFGLLIMNLVNNGKSYNNSVSNEPKKEQTQSSSKSSTKEKTSDNEEENDKRLTKSEVKKINKQLVKDLKEDQNFATDGNSNYDYANYVLKITLENKYAAKVMVDGSFDKLSDEAKTEVGKRIIKLIQTSILSSGIELSAEDEQTGIRLSVWNGPQFEGYSKATNTYEFKWK